MIRLSATATHGVEDRRPVCFVLYAQGRLPELASFAQRYGLEVLPVRWYGEPIAAWELQLAETPQARARVLTLLDLVEKREGYAVTWLQDLAPDLPVGQAVANVYPTRQEFLEALEVLEVEP